MNRPPVSAWLVRRIERLVQETEIDGELTAMMSGMCDASDQHPGTRAPDIEKVGFFLEPLRWCGSQALEATAGGFGVMRQEVETSLRSRKLGKTDVDAKHPGHPGVFGDTLVHHVLARRPCSGLRPEAEDRRRGTATRRSAS